MDNLIEEYKLRKGENKIKIIIKNKITNFKFMFAECKSLKNIEELIIFRYQRNKRF